MSVLPPPVELIETNCRNGFELLEPTQECKPHGCRPVCLFQASQTWLPDLLASAPRAGLAR